MSQNETLLQVRDLAVEFVTGEQCQRVVEGVSFDIRQGETLALVGESGSGKSVTAHSILRLLPYPLARHPHGSIEYAGEDLLKLSEGRLRGIRGNRIAMVFQEPMTSLNPLHSIEKQINEVLGLHKGLTGKVATRRTLELLELVGIPEPHKRLKALPSNQYQVLYLRQVEKKSFEEIAQIVGITPESVSVLLSRARKQMLQEIRKRCR